MSTVRLPERVKPLALSGSRTWGRMTASGRMLPGFLIVGGQRCGTTSMYRTLAQHPAVLKAVNHKGVHYFDMSYSRGMRWYQGHFPRLATAAEAERRLGVRPVTFESSPYYMFHPLAIDRIARDLPGVRVVVLVRDPVERAYSAHAHELARGYETADFETALRLEDERLAGQEALLRGSPGLHSHAHQHQAYRSRGRYVEQLERIAGLVGRERLLVVDSHEFFESPEVVYPRVLAFLGLPPIGADPLFDRHNARPRSAMADHVRAELTEYFRPYDERLAAWLGWSPSWLSPA